LTNRTYYEQLSFGSPELFGFPNWLNYFNSATKINGGEVSNVSSGVNEFYGIGGGPQSGPLAFPYPSQIYIDAGAHSAVLTDGTINTNFQSSNYAPALSFNEMPTGVAGYSFSGGPTSNLAGTSISYDPLSTYTGPPSSSPDAFGQFPITSLASPPSAGQYLQDRFQNGGAGSGTPGQSGNDTGDPSLPQAPIQVASLERNGILSDVTDSYGLGGSNGNGTGFNFNTQNLATGFTDNPNGALANISTDASDLTKYISSGEFKGIDITADNSIVIDPNTLAPAGGVAPSAGAGFAAMLCREAEREGMALRPGAATRRCGVFADASTDSAHRSHKYLRVQ